MNTQRHNKNIVEQFSKQASGYTSITSHSDALGRLIEMSSATREDTVLDVACGSGIVSCEFAKYTRHVTGIDMTQKMLDEAKKLQEKLQKKLQKKHNVDNINWELGDVNSLPYPDDHFSIVVSRFGFHHFLSPYHVLTEMKRVCKPHGVVMVVDVSLPDSKIDQYNEMEKNRDSSHVAALSLTEFSNLFKKAGFNKVETDNYNMRIELNEQLQASFPRDAMALKNRIIKDIGINDLGINAMESRGDIFLNYPIHICSARKL